MVALGALIHFEPLVEKQSSTSELQLVRASLAGEEDAFAALVRRHQARVFRLASRFFKRPQDVEDVAQETFLRAWTKLSSYRAEAPLEHWLTRLCLRCIYDRLRRRTVEQPSAGEFEAVAPASDPDARLEVERLLNKLSERDRFILVLLDGEGWSVAEIAARLGWSQANVKVRAHRARRRLRRILEEG
jgi:RNA polymerase sigma-70 factor (ECF subfamily)